MSDGKIGLTLYQLSLIGWRPHSSNGHLPVLINGVEIPEAPNSIPLLPGVYTVTSDYPYVEIINPATFTIEGDILHQMDLEDFIDERPELAALEYRITPEGVAIFRQKAKAKAIQCLDAIASRSEGSEWPDRCQNYPRFPIGDNKTWAFDDESAFDNLQPELRDDSLLVKMEDLNISVTTKAIYNGQELAKTIILHTLWVDLMEPGGDTDTAGFS